MPQTDSKSSSGQEQQQNDQNIQNPHSYPQHFEDDSIDLYKLCLSLWKWKWLVFTVTVVAALGSIVYALQLQHVYKAEALLLPPNAKDVQLLDVLGINQIQNSDGISPNTVFRKFKQNINSIEMNKKFIHEKGLMEQLAPDRNAETRDEEIYMGFASLIKRSIRSLLLI